MLLQAEPEADQPRQRDQRQDVLPADDQEREWVEYHDSDAHQKLHFLRGAHRLRVVAPDLDHPVIGQAVQDAPAFSPVGTMTAQNAGLPHKEEEQHVANPADEIPAKSAPYHPGDDSNRRRQETSQEVQQVAPVKAAVQRIADGAIGAPGNVLPGADAEWVSIPALVLLALAITHITS